MLTRAVEPLAGKYYNEVTKKNVNTKRFAE